MLVMIRVLGGLLDKTPRDEQIDSVYVGGLLMIHKICRQAYAVLLLR